MCRICVLIFISYCLIDAQDRAPDESPKEIVVKHEDGTFTLREVQLIGRGVPSFHAKILNGMSHDWEFPVFEVVYEGHELKDSTKKIRQSFTVRGMCTWAKGRECTVTKGLDFPLFFIETYEFKLIDGSMKLTPEEKRLDAERRIAQREAESQREAIERQRANERLAAARAAEAEQARKVRMACNVVYRDTSNKKIGDLTVKEEQQVRACQVLGLYSSK